MDFKCIALDFDNCLAYYKDDRVGLFKIFTDMGFTEDEARGAYNNVDEAEGVSLGSLVKSLEKMSARPVDKNGLKEKFDSWVESSVTLYPGVKEFLERVRLSGKPIVIVTFGSEEFQTQKVETSKIIYDKLMITRKAGEKFLALEELLERYGKPIVFVDDKPGELDNARRKFAGEEVKLFRVIRPTGPHVHKNAELDYPEIKNLEEVFG